MRRLLVGFVIGWLASNNLLLEQRYDFFTRILNRRLNNGHGEPLWLKILGKVG